MKGFYHRLLLIDVGEKTFTVQPVEDNLLKMCLGGKGLASFLLLAHNPAQMDPLGPDNRLIFATGPVAGSSVWGSCRHGVYTKSPQTGFFSESYAGGTVAEHMASTGYDAVIIYGAAEHPVWLEITAETVEFHSAVDLRATFYKPELSGLVDPDQIDGKAEIFTEWEDRLTIFDTLILCRFYRDLYQWEELSTIIGAITGLRLDAANLRRIASDVSDAGRFNIREGLRATDDSIPARFHREPLPETRKVIIAEQMEQLLGDYYRARGWNAKGEPPPE